MPDISSELQSRFDLIENFDPEYRDWGYMVLPVSGAFMRTQVDLDAFVFALKACLPKDARLNVVDGLAMRMSVQYGRPEDLWNMVFGSKEWPQVEEGAILPRLEPIFLGDYVTGNPVCDMQVLGYTPPQVGLQVRVDKRTHKLVIRKEDETESEVWIRVEPLEAQ